MDQAVQAVRLSYPDMQFTILLVYSWVLPELFCRQVDPMPATVRFVIGYRLFAALALGCWEIANLRHLYLRSIVLHSTATTQRALRHGAIR
jgi:hypothetical protein